MHGCFRKASRPRRFLGGATPMNSNCCAAWKTAVMHLHRCAGAIWKCTATRRIFDAEHGCGWQSGGLPSKNLPSLFLRSNGVWQRLRGTPNPSENSPAHDIAAPSSSRAQFLFLLSRLGERIRAHAHGMGCRRSLVRIWRADGRDALFQRCGHLACCAGTLGGARRVPIHAAGCRARPRRRACPLSSLDGGDGLHARGIFSADRNRGCRASPLLFPRAKSLGTGRRGNGTATCRFALDVRAGWPRLFAAQTPHAMETVVYEENVAASENDTCLAAKIVALAIDRDLRGIRVGQTARRHVAVWHGGASDALSQSLRAFSRMDDGCARTAFPCLQLRHAAL